MTGDQIIDMHMDSARRMVSELMTEKWRARVIGEAFATVRDAFLYCEASQKRWEEAHAELDAMWDALSQVKEAA